MNKKVVVIDNDELFRAGLIRLIDSFDKFEVRLNISSKEFDEMVTQNKKLTDYQLVILSPPLPSVKGVRMCEKTVRVFASCPVMVFSNYYSKFTVLKAIESGISAYFTKGISPFELEDILVDLTSRKNFSDIKLEPKVRNALLQEEAVEVSFTEAEEEVLKLVCQQKSSSEISEDLGISVRTVESRKRNMMVKTHSKNIIGVVMIFLRSRRFQENSQLPPG